ncbi:phytanoyl-CoA dioxygenase family protein [Candidatus Poriferisocius sp.]|uniref:phytanoyl-CoA dioxygenase family protein n=1 Tax=Candidatus Poriferisocius sp. TaxID=3101276 RepID=UPI003B0142C2
MAVVEHAPRLPFFDSLDFDSFHTVELPRRLVAGNGPLAAGIGAGALAKSFAWRLIDGRSVTYIVGEDDVEIRPGDDADVVVEVSEQDWCNYVAELWTWVGLLYAEAAVMVRGDFGLFEDFEPVLLAMYHGRPLYEGWTPTVDLDRSFAPDDDPEEMRRFLTEAGFLHIRGVFSAGEVEDLREEVERLRSLATPDDHRSWWAVNADGEEVCCRVTHMDDRSELMFGLTDDRRLDAIAALAGDDLAAYPERGDGVSVVIKLPRIVEGLADLPWHRDCGTGGHSITCPTANVGIQLDECNEDNGRLHFLAGSYNSTNRSRQVRDNWPTVAINASPGDVTVHFGHTMHAAPPPTAAPKSGGRRTVYISYHKALWAEFIPPGQGYNDILFRDGGRIRSPEEMQALDG